MWHSGCAQIVCNWTPERPEFMWCVPPRRRHQLPTDQLTVQSASITPVESVRDLRDLGVYLDSDMSMHTHVTTRLVGSCYGVLRQLRSIRRSLPRSALTTLVTSFIMSKVDYCNAVLAGLPQRELDRVLVCQQMLADTTTWHRSLWTFTGCGCRNASNTNCPCWCIVASTEQRHDTWQSWQRPSAALSVVACGRRHLPIPSCQLHVDQQSAIARSPLLAREHAWTVYLLLSAPLPHTTSSKRP